MSSVEEKVEKSEGAVKRGVYFLCPKCKEFYREFSEDEVRYVNTNYFIRNNGRIVAVDEEFIDGEHSATICPKCGVVSHSWLGEEFLVRVEIRDGKMFVEPLGECWLVFIDDLKKLGAERGFEVIE